MKTIKSRVYLAPEGLTIKMKGTLVTVNSEKFNKDPHFNIPYIKVKSKVVPENRPNINEWFKKFTPNS